MMMMQNKAERNRREAEGMHEAHAVIEAVHDDGKHAYVGICACNYCNTFWKLCKIKSWYPEMMMNSVSILDFVQKSPRRATLYWRR